VAMPARSRDSANRICLKRSGMKTEVLPDIEDNPVGLGRQLPGRWEKEARIQAATV
jgi:hypothetical protein